MTETQALAALPLTPEEERIWRDFFDKDRRDVPIRDVRRWIATLDAARLTASGVHVGDEGLREALALANSMIRSGERHSPQSEAIIRAALAPREAKP